MALEAENGFCRIYIPAGNKRVNIGLESFYGKATRVKWFNPLSGKYSVETLTAMEDD